MLFGNVTHLYKDTIILEKHRILALSYGISLNFTDINDGVLRILTKQKYAFDIDLGDLPWSAS